MNFWNSLKAIPLALALTFIHPSILEAQDNVSYNIQDIIEREIWNASIIDLNKAIFLEWKDAKIKEWEYIYVLYQTNTIHWKEVGILVSVKYLKNEMKEFKVISYPSSDWSYVKMMLAKKWTKMVWADFVVYKIKK